MLALHEADVLSYEQARRQVCEDNGVPLAKFHRMNLLYFLGLERRSVRLGRRIVSVWESDGEGEHRQVFDGTSGSPVGSGLVSEDALQAAGRTIDRLLLGNVRRIEEVRAALVSRGPEP